MQIAVIRDFNPSSGIIWHRPGKSVDMPSINIHFFAPPKDKFSFASL